MNTVSSSTTPDKQITEFGLYVTSNKSNSHIVFGEDADKTPCGYSTNLLKDIKHPNSDIRWWLSAKEFRLWMKDARNCKDDGYRFCKHCLKAYDKLERAKMI